MNKPVSMFFLMICSLSTTFFYQNCAEIENTNVSPTQIEYLPLFTNQLKLFEDSKAMRNCKNLNEVLYSKSHNLCFEVSDTCSFALLVKNGFKPIEKNLENKITSEEPASLNGGERQLALATEVTLPNTPAMVEELDLKARIQNCQIFVDINDLKPVDFKVIGAPEVGYTPKPDVMCSMTSEPLVNFKNRTCLTAMDGCQSAFLKEKGFVHDYYSMCPQNHLKIN